MSDCPVCLSYSEADHDRIDAAGTEHRVEMGRVRSREALGLAVTTPMEWLASPGQAPDYRAPYPVL